MFRINVRPEGCETHETLSRQAEYAISLGLPVIQPQLPHGTQLAIVGGGVSASRNLPELRSWGGEIWAINGACSWLAKQGIRSTLICVDPQDCLTPLLDGVESALLASHCHPSSFDALKGKDVRIFHIHELGGENAIVGGSTTATRIPILALRLGYTDVSYFGCEGSFEGSSHAYKSEADPNQVIIKAGDSLYRTSMVFMLQTENLGVLIRSFPNIFRDRSGGLLSAMLKHWDTWEIVALSKALRDELDPTSTTEFPFPETA